MLLPRPGPRRRVRALLPLLLAAAVALGGCSDGEAPASSPVPDRIAELDPATTTLARVAFCDLVAASAITSALGGRHTDARHWRNGEAAPVRDDAAPGDDLTHEFGCSWTRAGGFAARAWVFARPVTAAFARRVIASARANRTCSTRRTAVFGRPSMMQECPLAKGRARVRHAGLFGDTWLTCEVAGPQARTRLLRQRADGWCASVAAALRTK